MCESGHIYKTCHFVSVTSFFIGFCPTRRNVKLCRFMEQSIYPLFVSCPVSKGHNLEQATDGKDKNCSHFGPMKQLREARYMGEGRMVYWLTRIILRMCLYVAAKGGQWFKGIANWFAVDRMPMGGSHSVACCHSLWGTICMRFSLNDVSASLLDYQHSMSFCFHIFSSWFRGISTLKTYKRKNFSDIFMLGLEARILEKFWREEVRPFHFNLQITRVKCILKYRLCTLWDSHEIKAKPMAEDSDITSGRSTLLSPSKRNTIGPSIWFTWVSKIINHITNLAQ